jgi:hypothetical protein
MKTQIRLFIGLWAFLAAGTVFGQGPAYVCKIGSEELKTTNGKKIGNRKTCEVNGGRWVLKNPPRPKPVTPKR